MKELLAGVIAANRKVLKPSDDVTIGDVQDIELAIKMLQSTLKLIVRKTSFMDTKEQVVLDVEKLRQKIME